MCQPQEQAKSLMSSGPKNIVPCLLGFHLVFRADNLCKVQVSQAMEARRALSVKSEDVVEEELQVQEASALFLGLCCVAYVRN